jgi:murein DD-endopeptidase MepM/ murein hydrolase activator NlpD
MIMFRRKYVLDQSSLEFRQVNLAGRQLLGRLLFWFFISLMSAGVYALFIGHYIGSPKKILLQRQLEEEKLKYQLMQKDMSQFYQHLADLRVYDEMKYRPILNLELVSDAQRLAGVGGVEKYSDMSGYINSEVMIRSISLLDDLKRRAVIQSRSFAEIRTAVDEWKVKMKHLPMISPVRVTIPLGEGLKKREVHPVHGTPSWHRGQDFSTPVGTEVYATGAGTVIAAGWNSGGYGNFIRIDHGYGYQTTYGHLSHVGVEVGQKVIRGDKIGLSGNTGVSTGPHLHYEIALYGNTENPLHYFSSDLTEEEYNEMIQTLSSGKL